MGRPALYLIRVHTALSNEDLDKLDERAGPKGRAAFIRDAVQHLLSVRKILNRYRQSDE